MAAAIEEMDVDAAIWQFSLFGLHFTLLGARG